MCGTNFFPLTPPLMWQIVSERPLTEINQPVPGGSNSSSQQHIGEEYIHIGSDLYCRFSGIWIYVWMHRGVMSKKPNGFPGGLNAYFIVRVSPFFSPFSYRWACTSLCVCQSEDVRAHSSVWELSFTPLVGRDSCALFLASGDQLKPSGNVRGAELLSEPAELENRGFRLAPSSSISPAPPANRQHWEILCRLRIE